MTDPSFTTGKCAECGQPLSLEVGITNYGSEGDSKLYCTPCAPNSGRGYTLSDFERWREGDELGPGLHKVGPSPYDYVFNPAEGQRVTVVDVDGKTFTGTVTAFAEDKATGRLDMTVE